MGLIRVAVALAVLLPSAAWAENIPVAPILSAGYTLPAGKTEMGVGGDVFQNTGGNEWYVNPMVFFRYGLREGFEILPLGFRWQVITDHKREHQMGLKVRLAGLNDSSGDESFYSWEAAVEGKVRIHPELALTYYVGNYRTEYANGGYANALGAGGGALISMGNHAALEVSYSHETQMGLGSSAGDSVGMAIYWMPEPGSRLSLATTSNLLPRNDAFRFGQFRNINQAWTLGVTWMY